MRGKLYETLVTARIQPALATTECNRGPRLTALAHRPVPVKSRRRAGLPRREIKAHAHTPASSSSSSSPDSALLCLPPISLGRANLRDCPPPRRANPRRFSPSRSKRRAGFAHPEPRALTPVVGRSPAPRVLASDAFRAAVSREDVSDSKRGLVLSVWSPMASKERKLLTADELNATVYRYLQNSGFVHTAFNFFNEAGLAEVDIEGMKIPPYALITIVDKGLHFIELQANSEVSNDEEYHVFDILELITNDLDELKRKITSSAKLKTDKEQKNDTVKTDKKQKIGSDETTTTARIQSTQQTKVQRMDATEQSISAAETAQKTAATSQKTATPPKRRLQLERRGATLKLKRQKGRK